MTDSLDRLTRSITATVSSYPTLDKFIADLEDDIKRRGYRVTSVYDKRHERR